MSTPGYPDRFKRAITRSERPDPPKKEEPPQGDLKVAGKWGSFTVPAIVVTGFLSLLGGKVWDSGKAELIRSDIQELRQDTRTWRDEDRASIREIRTRLDLEHQYTKRNIPIIVKVIERQAPSAKFVWEQGWQPDVDFEPSPLGGIAPKLQPSLALIRPPVWDN